MKLPTELAAKRADDLTPPELDRVWAAMLQDAGLKPPASPASDPAPQPRPAESKSKAPAPGGTTGAKAGTAPATSTPGSGRRPTQSTTPRRATSSPRPAPAKTPPGAVVDPRAEFREMVVEFGREFAAQMFAQGVPINKARVRYTKHLRTQLDAALERLRQLGESGAPKPVSTGAPAEE